MSNNVVIMDPVIDAEKEEPSCKQKVINFFQNQLQIDDLNLDHVDHAKGKIGPKPRNMIVRCHFSLKERIFKCTKI